MRKQTKLVAVLSATALLAIGASAVAFAEGWDVSTGEWQWLDKDGIAVSNEWKKSGNDWFYLGDDGNMVTDAIVEDTKGSSIKYYYVNEQGAMVSNAWKAIDNVDTDYACDYFWYYFGADGKAYTSTGNLSTSKLKEINGKKYAFDSEGKMLYGWVDGDSPAEINESEDAWKEAEYFFGDWTDGAMRTDWQELTVDDDGDTKTYWFWFDGKSGKKVANKEKKIDGKAYLFAEDGHMLADWASSTGSISTGSIIYLNGDGAKRTKTWIWAVPEEDYIEDNIDFNDDTARWWYAGANGALYRDRISKINGKRYAFDEYGRMKTGLVSAQTNNYVNYSDVAGIGLDGVSALEFANKSFYTNKDEVEGGIYMFGDTDDGSMKFGYQNVEFDDDIYQMYFNTTNGEAVTNYVSKIKKFTANGIVLKANADYSNYAGVAASEEFNTDEKFKTYSAPVVSKDELVYYSQETVGKILVNTSGAVMKNKTNLKDGNDYYYTTNENGRTIYAGTTKIKKVKTKDLKETDEKVTTISSNDTPEGYTWVYAD